MMKYFLDDPEEVDYLKLLEETSAQNKDAQGVENQRLTKLTENDLSILKSSLLFRNWDPATFMTFIEDNYVCLKHYK